MKSPIVFYQQYAVPYFGILSIAAHLKYNGFRSEVIIDTLETHPIETIKQLEPTLIGISVLSTEHTWLIRRCRSLRRALPETTIIVGGVHAIFYPEEILLETSANLVCHSEGEKVIIDIIKGLDKSVPNWGSIPGLAYKNDEGDIHINERASLVPFSDDIIEDRSMYYDRYPQLAEDVSHRFFSSRGCPYRCSFCYNANIHDVFKGKGIYVRQKSVHNFIQELALQCQKYPIQFIQFYDDLFTFNKKWLTEFLNVYKKNINLPFWCTTRANLIDTETARMLAEAGCRTVSFGVETGNFHIRKNVLNKHITDEEIICCGNLLHDYGIKVQTTNMFCLPDETVEDALTTIELNIEAKADYVFTALFMPFPKTALTNYCIQKGLLKPDYSLKDLPHSFVTTSVLSIPKVRKETISNVHRLAQLFVKWSWTFKFEKKLVYMRFLSPLFQVIFLFFTVFRFKEERGITSWWATFRYAWRLRKSV
jgi:anaerobic magnesium-protoporphyrin IX monomethyl ester cyclase